MQPPDDLYERWHEACRRERETWERVKDKLPDTPQFDPALWEEWREAIKVQDAARRALVKALDDWGTN
ncbi:hypothetical protein ACPWT1_00020 [Ramlibacter sp. MMS24-I3-19]|uniref:hypothetical protein n=1 Tax=Ramlibacter sp. MMS24-I3-19 TaxID=3416606 RepID=UPI003D03660A